MRTKESRTAKLDELRNLDFDFESNLDISSLFSSTDSKPVTMSYDPDLIFKAMRLVPEFDGNPNVLTRFIRICEEIVTEYVVEGAPKAELAKICVINGILNKITGNAARIINSNGIPETWEGIKGALINNFSDQRDETSLYNDLMIATQGSSTPQEFFDRCVNLFSTIMTYVTLHETISTTIEAKRILYRKLTLQAYVRGLREPLGSRIRCMRPDSIEKALEFVQEETNVIYLQQRNDSLPDRKIISKMPPQAAAFTMPPVQKLFNFAPPVSTPQNNWQKPLPPPQPNSWRPYQFNTFNQSAQQPNNMPSRTQQMFRAPPPSYNPQLNRFTMPPPRNSPQSQGPKPMSGVSHFVTKTLPSGHDWRRFGNPPPSNYFKTREMNMNECYSYEDYYQPDEESYYSFDPYETPLEYTYYNSDVVTNDVTPYQMYSRYSEHGDTTHCERDPSNISDEPQASSSQAPIENFQKGGRSTKSK